jgi:hypothetical protein
MESVRVAPSALTIEQAGRRWLEDREAIGRRRSWTTEPAIGVHLVPFRISRRRV